MSVRVTLRSDQTAGGTGSDSFTSADFANSAAAVAAVSNGFINFANPIDAEQSVAGKSRAVSTAVIREIQSI